MADPWVPLRAGSDIVFLGALINHVLTHDLAFRDYIVPFTNAATIISETSRTPRISMASSRTGTLEKKQYATESWR